MGGPILDARAVVTNPAGRYQLDPARVIGIAIHHTVTWAGAPDGYAPERAAEFEHISDIDVYHRDKGWGGFGYHLVVFPSGNVYLCGDLTGARAHVASRNHELIGIALVGDFTNFPPGPRQFAGAIYAVAYVLDAYPGRPVRGHRDWALPEYPTSCPGDTWRDWVPMLDPAWRSPGNGEEESMKLVVIKGDQRPEQYALCPDGRKVHIVNMAHRQALEAAGVLDPGQLQVLPQSVVDAIPERT
jgi:hypothetical protein